MVAKSELGGENVTEMYNPFSFFFPSNKKEGFKKEKEL